MDLKYTDPTPSMRSLCARCGPAYSTLRHHYETTFRLFDHAEMCVALGFEPIKWILTPGATAAAETAPKVGAGGVCVFWFFGWGKVAVLTQKWNAAGQPGGVAPAHARSGAARGARLAREQGLVFQERCRSRHQHGQAAGPPVLVFDPMLSRVKARNPTLEGHVEPHDVAAINQRCRATAKLAFARASSKLASTRRPGASTGSNAPPSSRR